MEKLKLKIRRLDLATRVKNIEKQKALLDFSDSIKALSASEKTYKIVADTLDSVLLHERAGRATATMIDPVQQAYYSQHVENIAGEVAAEKVVLDENTESHRNVTDQLRLLNAKETVYEQKQHDLKKMLFVEKQKMEMMDLVSETSKTEGVFYD